MLAYRPMAVSRRRRYFRYFAESVRVANLQTSGLQMLLLAPEMALWHFQEPRRLRQVRIWQASSLEMLREDSRSAQRRATRALWGASGFRKPCNKKLQ